MRDPAGGREIIIEAEPDGIYRDRETASSWRPSARSSRSSPSGSKAPVGGREPAVLHLVRPAGPEGPQRLSDLRPPHGAARIAHGRPLNARRLPTGRALAVAAGIALGGRHDDGLRGWQPLPLTRLPRARLTSRRPTTPAPKKRPRRRPPSTTDQKNLHRRKRRRHIRRQRSDRRTRKRRQLQRRRRTAEATPSGGASPEQERETEKSAAGSSPSGGASAPTGK